MKYQNKHKKLEKETLFARRRNEVRKIRPKNHSLGERYLPILKIMRLERDNDYLSEIRLIEPRYLVQQEQSY